MHVCMCLFRQNTVAGSECHDIFYNLQTIACVWRTKYDKLLILCLFLLKFTIIVLLTPAHYISTHLIFSHIYTKALISNIITIYTVYRYQF